jgi:hypothetical protein
VNVQKPDIQTPDPIDFPDIQTPEPFNFWTNLCLVFEWLKQYGDHSKTGPNIEFSASLEHFLYKQNIFFLYKTV